ncbi:MAG: pyrroline-5-carboxylate reductase [Steroidobacteraceae bacterium]
MLTETLAFIGGGNMARSLIGGLIAQGLPAQQITVADPMETQRQQLVAQYGVHVTASNADASAAQIIVLAVKPQELRGVAQQLRSSVANHRPLIISVAAGIRASDLHSWIGLPVVRTMPNRPALNGCGITGMYASSDVPSAQRELAERIMNAVGKSVWVEQETLIDAVTAISGSGPAYFFLLMELLEAAGIEQGLPVATARSLAIETAYGSGMMARDGDESPATLRAQVTSKGGTTAAALQVFENRELRQIVSAAVQAAADRSAEMATILGGQ